VTDADATVGFIGLGIMGRPMARNLLRHDFQVVVHSRTADPVDELVAAGARASPTPSHVGDSAPTIITMLPDTTDVNLVLFGPSGLASSVRQGSLVIDMSTIDPLASKEFADRLERQGAAFLDAPVSGGEKGAIEGALSIMVGGRVDAFRRALPIFQALGKKIVHVGSSGAGQLAKACNQLIVASTIQAVAEALNLAELAGVDPAKVREALREGFAGSRILELHGQRMLEGDFRPGFRVRLHRKDARIILDAAAQAGAPVTAFAVAAHALERLAEVGGGELDHSALITLLRDGHRRAVGLK
jgi:2-hydroxy-3-oxopropionate reductase